MGYAQQGAAVAGGTLGGIGDIVQAVSHKKLKIPPATAQEVRLRGMTMQDLANARQTVYGGSELYNQTLPYQMGAIPGYSAEVTTDPNAAGQLDQLAAAAGNRISLQNKLATTAKGGGVRRAIKKQLKGTPKMRGIRKSLNQLQATAPRLKITKNAPTQTDINSQQIQDALSNRTLEALHGGLPNPTLEHNLQREQMQMEDHMRNQLGPDWENSTAGIQARQQFDQYANDQRDISNRRDISTLYPEQLAGQNAQYGFAGAQQGLLGQPSMDELRMAQAMGTSGAASTAAQQPYQYDRSLQSGVNSANWQYGNPWGHALQQSGDRWIQAAGAMGGGGGGKGDAGAAPQGW